VAFTRDYNEERPHQALGQLTTPASRLSALATADAHKRLPEPHYPSKRGCATSAPMARSNGVATLIHISSALAARQSPSRRPKRAIGRSASSTCPLAHRSKQPKAASAGRPRARGRQPTQEPKHEWVTHLSGLFVTHLSAGQEVGCCDDAPSSPIRGTPTPNPSPQGGGENTSTLWYGCVSTSSKTCL